MSAELACTYAALILSDDGVDISGDKIASLLKVKNLHVTILKMCFQAANVDVEPFWPGLFAGALKNCNVSELISNISSGVGAGPAAAGGAAAGGAAEEAKEEEKKPESSSESDEDMGFDMFG